MSKVFLRKYGVATTILFDLFEIDGIDLKIDAVHVSGDTTIIKDEVEESNPNTTNGFVDIGQTYSIDLTATEMEAARIKIPVVDQSSSKAWLDTTITIETYGHANAQHAFDLDAAIQDVNVTQISGDSTAADNLESQYDTTGLVGDTFPSTQEQLSGLANVGSAVHRPAASYTLTTGTQSANTFAETEALDGVRHEHTDTAGAMDLYYEFNIGAGVPSSAQITGYVNGNNDDLDVYGYDWIAAAWVQIGNIQGRAASINEVNSFDMFVDMVGSGVNSGIVRIRLYKASGLTSATLAIDQIFVAFNQGIEGYQNAAIWFDSNASNTNTVRGIDGTATNPVSTMAAVNTLLSLTNLSRIEVIAGSTITLSASQNNQVFSGENWTLALGGQDISGSSFIGAHVSGIATGTGTEQTFRRCHLDACTHIKETHILESGIIGTQTVGEAGDYHFDRCYSSIAGTTTWIFDFGAAIGNTNLNLRNYSGGVQLENMGDTGTDTASIEGRGQVIEGTCTAGVVAIRGLFETSGITNLTLVDGSRYERDTHVDAVWDEVLDSSHNVSKSSGRRLREVQESPGYEGGLIYIDTINGTAGSEVYINGTLDNPVNNITDANTIAATLNVTHFHVSVGSSITLLAAQENSVFEGDGWSVNFNGQNIGGSIFHGADISGIGTGTTSPLFFRCKLNGATIPVSEAFFCGFDGDLILGSAGTYIFDACYSAIAGTGTPSIDFGTGLGDTNVNIRHYSGGIELKNMGQSGVDRASVEADGQIVLNANCIGGTLAWRGHITLTDNSSNMIITGDNISIGLEDVKGSTFDTNTDSLAALSGVLDAIKGSGFDTNADSLKVLSDVLEAIKGAGWTIETLKAIYEKAGAEATINIVSAITGAITVKYAENQGSVQVVKGDTVSIPYGPFGKDIDGRRLYFAAKYAHDDAEFAIAVKEITSSISDTSTFTGIIPLLSSETGLDVGDYFAEAESRDSDGISNPLTEFKFTLSIVDQVVT